MRQNPNTLNPEIIPATEAVNDLVGKGIYLLGHGSHLDGAIGSLTGGLQSRHTDLFSVVLGLESLANSPAAAEHNMALLRQWPHLDSKHIVLIGVERLDDDKIPHRRYLQSIMQPREHGEAEDQQFGSPYVVPQRFVAGYFDMTNETFVSNPNFDPHYDPGLLETTANEQIQNELNPGDPMGHIALEKPVIPTVPEPPPNHDIPSVW